MRVNVGGLDVNFAMRQPPRSAADRRHTALKLAVIRQQHGVRFQQVGVRADKFVQMAAADFFFPFNQQFDVDRQRAVYRQKRLNGRDIRPKLAFIVRCAARVNIAVPNSGRKRRRHPQIKRFRRLHVIMSVNQHRRCGGAFQPFGIDDWMAGRRHDFDCFQADFPQMIGDKFGAAPHVSGMFRQRADAWNAEHFEKFITMLAANWLFKLPMGRPVCAGA